MFPMWSKQLKTFVNHLHLLKTRCNFGGIRHQERSCYRLGGQSIDGRVCFRRVQVLNFLQSRYWSSSSNSYWGSSSLHRRRLCSLLGCKIKLSQSLRLSIDRGWSSGGCRRNRKIFCFCLLEFRR